VLGERVKGFDRDFLRALATAATAGKLVLGEQLRGNDPIRPSPGQRIAVRQQRNIRPLNTFTDGDDTVRRIPLSFTVNGATVTGMALELAARAHRIFPDYALIGWDIAILEDGPILIEGNGNPDMDIIQRFMRVGLRRHRFGELLAFHLRNRSNAFRAPQSASTSSSDETDRRHPHERQADAGRIGVGAQLPQE